MLVPSLTPPITAAVFSNLCSSSSVAAGSSFALTSKLGCSKAVPLHRAALTKRSLSVKKGDAITTDCPVTEHEHYCYLLHSPSSGWTYTGYTTDPIRRLSQHNGLRAGGAKSTRAHRPWEYVALVRGFSDKSSALRWEWAWKHPAAAKNRYLDDRFRKTTTTGATGRLEVLGGMMQAEEQQSQISDLTLCFWYDEEWKLVFDDACQRYGWSECNSIILHPGGESYA